jgi:hypothetical protein
VSAVRDATGKPVHLVAQIEDIGAEKARAAHQPDPRKS